MTTAEQLELLDHLTTQLWQLQRDLAQLRAAIASTDDVERIENVFFCSPVLPPRVE